MATNAWIEAIGWALVHSIWQGAALAGALAILLGLLRRSRPQVRYLLACLTLALMLLLPAATAVQVHRALASAAPVSATLARAESSLAHREVARDDPASLPSLLPTPVRAAMVRTVGALDARLGAPLHGAIPMLTLAWAIGVVALLVRLAGGWAANRELARQAVRQTPDAWLAMLARLCAELRVRRPVQLLLSARVAVPTVVGWLRPVLLFPVAALSGLTPHQVELLLRHELAHIRRHDYLVNLLQSIAEVLLFHHPAAWWVSRRIRLEREHCCDEAVAATAGVPAYVRALLAMEELRCDASSGAHALALGADGAPLLARVRRMIGSDDALEVRARGAPILTLLAIGALLGTLALGGRGEASAAPLRTTGSSAPIECADDDGRDTLTLCPALTERVAALLASTGAEGTVIVQDVRTGAVISYAAASRTGDLAVTTALVPASVWKLTIAALWWEHGFGDATVPCPAELHAGRSLVRNAGRTPGPMDATRMLVESCNTAAATMAFALRDRLGPDVLGADLRRLGFPAGDQVDAFARADDRDSTFWASTSATWRARMSPATAWLPLPDPDDDAAWAELALGHPRVRVTPLHLSRLLQAIGNDGVMLRPTVERALAARAAGDRVMQPSTARRLRDAMRRVVNEGTARGVAPLLADARWSLGGKTGTSQPPGTDRVDGWFVGLLFDEEDAPRYTVVVHLRGGGSGGGAPARLAAALTRELGGVRARTTD